MLAIDLLLAGLILITIVMGIWIVQMLFLRISSIPSADAVIEAMLEMARLKPGQTVVDLGAGDGRILQAAKRRHHSVRAVGWEGGLFTWMLGRILCKGMGVELRLGSLYKADVRDADVVFLYLWPSIMKRLGPKLRRELKPGAIVISHSFELPDAKASEETIVMVGSQKHTVRAYVF